MNKYEIMFLFDPTFATDVEKVREEIERILGRADAKITFLEKWDERRLAYEIEGRRRGTYFLVYFDCAGDKITGIERDARLSETVLRVLIKRADNITPAVIERFMPSTRPVAVPSKPGDEGTKPSTPEDAKAPAPSAPAPSESPEATAPATDESTTVAVAEPKEAAPE